MIGRGADAREGTAITRPEGRRKLREQKGGNVLRARSKALFAIGKWSGRLAWALLLLSLLTGYGITQFRLVERLTLGLLTKPLAFRLHEYVGLPLLVLAIIHVGIGAFRRRRSPTTGVKS